MNNKLLKQNAMLIYCIINFVEELKSEKKKAMNNKNIYYSTNITLIHFYNDLIAYFEQCLKEVSKC